jgi:mRNA interferase RelE/StbE
MQKPGEVDLPDFRIFETNEFTKRLKKLPSSDAVFLRKKLDSHVYPQIKAEPFWGSNIKKLQGYSPDTWRYRIGKFRLFYIIDQKERIVFILTVDDRKDAYKG